MTKDEILAKYGRKDGLDEQRMIIAIEKAGELDFPLFIVFESLINLENQGFIKLAHTESSK